MKHPHLKDGGRSRDSENNSKDTIGTWRHEDHRGQDGREFPEEYRNVNSDYQ